MPKPTKDTVKFVPIMQVDSVVAQYRNKVVEGLSEKDNANEATSW